MSHVPKSSHFPKRMATLDYNSYTIIFREDLANFRIKKLVY